MPVVLSPIRLFSVWWAAVYFFVFNKAELISLRDLAFLAKNNTPKMTETSQFRDRLQNIYKEFDRVLKGFYENKK